MNTENGELLKNLRPKFELAGYSVQLCNGELRVFHMAKDVQLKDVKRILKKNVEKYTKTTEIEIVSSSRYSHATIRES